MTTSMTAGNTWHDHPVRLGVRNLEMWYEGVANVEGETPFVLRVPELSLEGGELIGVTGRSGEGKSTLMHVLGGLQRPPTEANQGFSIEAEYLGATRRVDARTSEEYLRALRSDGFGFIFQDAFLLQSLSVRENARLPFTLRPGDPADEHRLRSLMDRVGLSDRYDKKLPTALSGGQSQRVAAVRAFAQNPPFVFADEPTASLDVKHKSMVLEMLRDHADTGACVLLVSHELGDLARFCDRVLVVQNETVSWLPIDSKAADRSEEERARVRDQLSSVVWDVEDEASEKKDVTAAPASATPAAAPQSVPGLGMRAFRLAAAETMSGHRAGARAAVALILVVALMMFGYLRDVGNGAVGFVRDRAIGKSAELVSRIKVFAAGSGLLSAEEVEYLKGVDGLKEPPTLIQRKRIEFIGGHGDLTDETVTGVPLGDMMTQSTEDPDLREQQLGLKYVQGGPFSAAQQDQAGILVSRQFLQKHGWLEYLDDEIDERVVAPIEFRLSVEHDTLAPGFDGRVTVAVQGVFEYPEKLQGERKYGRFPQAFVTDAFCARLSRWDREWAVHYRRTDGQPMVEDYELVKQFGIKVPNPKDAGWRNDAQLRGRIAQHLRIDQSDLRLVHDEEHGDWLQVRLYPHARSTNPFPRRVPTGKWEAWTRRQGGRGSWVDAVTKQAGAPELFIVDSVSAAVGFMKYPPAESVQRDYAHAVLRVEKLEEVLAKQRELERSAHKFQARVRNPDALSAFEVVSNVVTSGEFFLNSVFLLALFLIVGMTAYLHVSAKTSDIGVLRAYGLGTRGIAWLYQLELTYIVLPACMAGLLVARGLAFLSNDYVANELRLVPESVGEAATEPERAIVFESLDASLGQAAGEISGILGIVCVALAFGGGISMLMIRRLGIVACLKTSG